MDMCIDIESETKAETLFHQRNANGWKKRQVQTGSSGELPCTKIKIEDGGETGTKPSGDGTSTASGSDATSATKGPSLQGTPLKTSVANAVDAMTVDSNEKRGRVTTANSERPPGCRVMATGYVEDAADKGPDRQQDCGAEGTNHDDPNNDAYAGSREGDHDTVIVETINVTSGTKQEETIIQRKAHLQCLQEMGLTMQQTDALRKRAKQKGKTYIGGPPDPELGKAAAGVGIMAYKGLNVYPVPNPTQDYNDAVKTGRVLIVCTDIDGDRLTCATIYGWTGGKKGTVEAARTDDLIAIVLDQFEKMGRGPKMINGDLNASIDALPTLQHMLSQMGWTDVGNHQGICKGRHGKPTCQSNAGVKESRIDYMITNEDLTPCIERCWVDQCGTFPTHRPLSIEINVRKLSRQMRTLVKPTNFAEMFENIVQEQVEEARIQIEKDNEANPFWRGEQNHRRKCYQEIEP
jgi:exonuclease III